jgi:peptidoglycan/xylan/chitin deacetylase (PgdA/CDA1 family)
MMKETKIGLCVDPVGNKDEIRSLCRLLQNENIRATVTVAGAVGKKPISTLDHLQLFLEGGHEIANHTRSHPVRIGELDKEEQKKEIILQHQRLIELGSEYGTPFPVRGFRAPFYAYGEEPFEVLHLLGYEWDSSAIYSPLLGVPFKPFVRKGVLEIPVLFPDDMTLLDRMLLDPVEAFEVWWHSYERTDRYFIFTIHPYGSAKDQRTLKAFEAFIKKMRKDGGMFSTLSEIAEDLHKRI